MTDGISGHQEPAVLQVMTPEGKLPRREAEWAIDGGKFSRNILMGSHTWFLGENGELLYHSTGRATTLPVVLLVIVSYRQTGRLLPTDGGFVTEKLCLSRACAHAP